MTVPIKNPAISPHRVKTEAAVPVHGVGGVDIIGKGVILFEVQSHELKLGNICNGRGIFHLQVRITRHHPGVAARRSDIPGRSSGVNCITGIIKIIC